jgi:uncharacterized protein YlzI (FlbEa/FlbD family)
MYLKVKYIDNIMDFEENITLITTVDGSKYSVFKSSDEVIRIIRECQKIPIVNFS